MPTAPPVPARPRLTGRLLRAGLAASLVLGVAAALPSLAAEPVHTDDSGYLEVPAPAFSGSDLAFDFATCPDAPPNQGVDAWVYDLQEHVDAGSPVTITGEDAAGTTDLAAYVYKTDCAYDRVETSAAALTVTMQEGDRFLAVATPTGMGTSLLLEVGEAGTTEPTTGPTATTDPTDPGTGGEQVMVRKDYSQGVNDEYYPETSTGPVGAIASGGQWGMRVIQAEKAWQQERATGAGVTVAVLDSGLDLTHPEFNCDPNKVAELDATRNLPHYDRFKTVTDPDGHGTHVAGIVGACTNNQEGVVGVAPDSTILPIQALSPEEATAERLAAAIDTAVDSGAHVINMSLGFSALGIPGTGSAVALVGGFPQIDKAIERAVAEGVVVVAAAGNESFPICGYPALAADVICVGSSDRRDLNSWYGNFPVTPEGVALLAPGGSGQVFCDVQSENVLSTYSTQVAQTCPYPEAGYRGLDGTSMASPHVAGVAALVYDRLGGERSAGNAAAVTQALVDSAVDLYTDGYDPMSGEGRVDALGAVLAVTPVQSSPTPTPTPTPTETTQESTTELELVAPSTVQTTDELALAAQVEDASSGAPVAGARVEFVLSGDGGTRTVDGTTGEDGVATAALPVDLAPGAYTLAAEYSGDPGTRKGAGDSQPVQVVRDDSSMTLTATGSGGNRVLSGTLTDADSSAGLAGATVVLLADGQEMATVTTDDSGAYSYSPERQHRAAQVYEARFAGDSRYEPSAATTS